MRAVVFGITGQDGYYLSRLLESKGIDVIGVSRKMNTEMDIASYNSVNRLISETKHDYIFHFAAHSTTSHDAAFANYAAISTGT